MTEETVLEGVRWETYESLSNDMGDSAVRLTYDQGRLGIVVSSPQRALLEGVRWETYERLLCDFESRSAPRFAYDRGTLEIMSPLFEHEIRNRILSLLVDTLADEYDQDVVPAGSTTFKRAALARGFEPDTCFYIQSVPSLPNDLKEWDADDLPPPDLVIEIDITHPSLDKLPLYAAFGVPEVWRDDGQQVFILRRSSRDSDRYEGADRSVAFPLLDAATLTRFVNDGSGLRRTEWLRRVRAWARGEKAGENR